MVIRQRLPEVESSAYYMISRFAELATYAGMTMVFVMFPLASEAHERGRRSYRLLRQMSVGTLAFGAVSTAFLYFCGVWMFNLVPTCRPYVAYVPDMALMAAMLTLNMIWMNYSQHELACNRFRFYAYGGPLTILQTIFLVCFTGYTFFNGLLPPAVVDWMASLNVATLRNLLWVQMVFAVLRLAGVAVEIAFCRYLDSKPI